MKNVLRIAASATVAATLLLFAGASGDSSSSGSSASAPAASSDGLTQVPKIDGLRMKVPDNAKPNRGAAGFHTDDDSFSLMIRKNKTATTMDAAKASAEQFAFEKWITTDAIDDGWVLTYESISIGMDGNKKPAWAFEVVRTLDGEQYKCSGSLPSETGLDAVVESCKSLKRG